MTALCALITGVPAEESKSSGTPPSEAEANPDMLVIDDMQQGIQNGLGGRTAVYQRAPSRVSFSKTGDYGRGEGKSGMKIVYDKKNEGGQTGEGGWCGFYTLLHRSHNDYRDLSQYKYLAFWVKGEKGGENFKVGAADKTWAEIDDSVKSDEIGKYLPAKKITTDWQLAVIPVDEWLIDWKQMHAFAICFEADCFVTGAGTGMVYISDMVLSRNKPDPSTNAVTPKTEGPKSAS